MASKEGFTTPPGYHRGSRASQDHEHQCSARAGASVPFAASPWLRGASLSAEANVVIHSLAGAATDRQLVSDTDGVFKLDDLQPGTYQITASKEKLTSPSATTVEIAENKTANANVQLASREHSGQIRRRQPTPAAGQPATASAPPAVDLQTPFAYADYTWLNGNSRNKDVVIDTPFFTPEVRFDTHFMTDFNQPIDHTIVGATESFRSGEFQVEQASVGGDFHWQNVRGRILFMQGLFATTTPRNDATPDVGQWDLRDAYKYVSEAYGGYHFNVNHGLNVDAGIFVSYIGLFSYYNFDNWTYQPSYVSSNTPWFFNGLRIQWFPTNKLKIEPWIINGWQSYARANGHHGFGGQILWRPKEWLSMVFNNYGNGTDAVGAPNRVRIHTDDSIEIRYYNKPESNGVSKMAFSFTGDLGCEYGAGGGTSCTGKGGQPKQAFLGWMEYNRIWFHKDLVAVTLGGGMMENPGRYLTLLPPIDGANAFSGSALLPGEPRIKCPPVGLHGDCAVHAQTVHHLVGGSWVPPFGHSLFRGPGRCHTAGRQQRRSHSTTRASAALALWRSRPATATADCGGPGIGLVPGSSQK